MKKRLLASFLSLCLLTGLMPAAALATESTSETEPLSCICETLCTADAANEACTICAADTALCAAEPTEESNTDPSEGGGKAWNSYDGTHPGKAYGGRTRG